MKKTLKEIFKNHEGKLSDKWTLYVDQWDRLFDPYQDKQIRLLEIGIQNGGSLEIWAKYFLNAEKIIGCDIEEKCRELNFDDDRISVVIGDANSDKCITEILRKSTTFDIIIDDGSHKSSDIVRTFARYFHFLNDGGIYVVEDLHASYWKYFEGGLYNPISAMAFFKRLTDVINYDHWRTKAPRKSILKDFGEKYELEFKETDLIRIHSIEFLNSLCIIRKFPSEKNELGKRIIVGKEQSVTDGFEQLNGGTIRDLEPERSEYGNQDIFDLQQDSDILKQLALSYHTIQVLSTQIDENEKTIKALEFDLAQSQEETLAYALSKSWKITRPLRKITALLKGNKNA